MGRSESKSQITAELRKEAEERAVAKKAEAADEILPLREFRMVRIENIVAAALNIRSYKGMDITPAIDPGLPELAESIKAQGVIEPVIVQLFKLAGRPKDCPAGETFSLIAGFRRLAASKMAGLDKVPACIYLGELTDRQITEIQITENIHRCDLKPTEEAAIYKRMAEQMGCTQEEIAERVGKSVKHVSRYIRLLTLPDEIRGKIDSGAVSLAKANVLLSLSKKNLDTFLERYDYLLCSNYSAKEFETEVHRRFYRELSGKKIGFDIDKSYKDGRGKDAAKYPPCSACPHRAQTELFEEYVADTVCPDAGCFDAKAWLALEEKHKAEERAEREWEKKRARGEAVPETAAERKKREQQEKYEAERSAWREESKRKAEAEAEETIKRARPLIARKFEFGFSGRDYFVVAGEDVLTQFSDVHTKALNALYKEYLGKDNGELMSSGSIEEIFKATVIYHIYNTTKLNSDEDEDYLDDEIKELLGMEVEKDVDDDDDEESEDEDSGEAKDEEEDGDGINGYKEEGECDEGDE